MSHTCWHLWVEEHNHPVDFGPKKECCRDIPKIRNRPKSQHRKAQAHEIVGWSRPTAEVIRGTPNQEKVQWIH